MAEDEAPGSVTLPQEENRPLRPVLYEQNLEKTDPLGRVGSAGEPANKRWDSAVVL
jgi:hypothetical protein